MYRITRVQFKAWPQEFAVEEALAAYGIGIDALTSLVGTCVHADPPVDGRGFQLDLGPTLKRHLYDALTDGSGLTPSVTKYSPRLNEEADLAFETAGSTRRLYFEIEFRPNVEKDLVKFQIGVNSGWLGAAVLIVTLDLNCINPRYTTMPEFEKFQRVIDELRPTYPLLMIGFAGEHDDARQAAD